MKKNINIRPDTGIFDNYKRTPYNYWTAFAEFIDNSTQSYLNNKNVLKHEGLSIEINYKNDENNNPYIEIFDNAYGMNSEEFKNALVLGEKPKNSSGRNEFGFGLKTAACWFGDYWSIESTQLGNKEKYYATMDIESFKNFKNEEIEVLTSDANESDHYTKLVIKNLNKKIVEDKSKGEIIKFLSSMYRIDFREQEIAMYFNGEKLSFKDPTPYHDEETNETYKKDIFFVVPHNGTNLNVSGFIALMIPGRAVLSGFAIFRRKRLIIGDDLLYFKPSEVFGAPNSFVSQRLYGELHLDNWPVTQAKDKIDFSSGDLKHQFLEKLNEICKDYKEKAENTKKSTRKSKNPDTTSPILSNSDPSEINTDSTDTSYLTSDNEELTLNNQTTIENYQENNQLFQNNANNVNVSRQEKIQEEKTGSFKFSIENTGTPVEFLVLLEEGKQFQNWIKINNFKDETKPYEIVINTNYPFFEPYKKSRIAMESLSKFAASIILAEKRLMETYNSTNVDITTIRITLTDILKNWKSNNE